MKGFSYMLSQAKGDKNYVREELQSVVLHQFGNHSHCRTWCAISKNPTKKHKDLVNNDLKQSLLAIFTKFDPDKLCKLDTSNNMKVSTILLGPRPQRKTL